MPNVLIADDSIAVRKVAERLLSEAGFGVTLAANGEEALAYLAKETPDLVVSDVIMPDKSGYEVCAFVRARSGLANTPVLLISGIVNDEVTKQAESCHADGVLKKPFQGTALKDRVIELLAKRQGAAAPKATNMEKAVKSVELFQRSRGSDEQADPYRQPVPRLSPLEGEPRAQPERSTVGDKASARVQELESLLKIERDRTAEALNQASAADTLSRRIWELEAALQKEREGAVHQAARLVELQANVNRIPELEASLYNERQASMQMAQQMTEMEGELARSQELSQVLAAEQERNKDLSARLSDAQRVSEKAQEFETLFQAERDRNSLLTRRVFEAEQASGLATKRFEEVAAKLGEIAGWAAQLGNGKRQP